MARRRVAIGSTLAVLVCSMLLQSCRANDDPFTVTVVNNTSERVIDYAFFVTIPGTSNGGGAVLLQPGESFADPEFANLGTDPDRITTVGGKVLGCLPFQFSENPPKDVTVNITEMVRCKHWAYEANSPRDWPNPDY
jgi:hypothetical protein